MNGLVGTVLSIQVGKPKEMGSKNANNHMQSPWISGIYKEPVSGRIWVGKTNLVGDGQAFINHGGPDKAVFVYSQENYIHWQQTRGLPAFEFGSQGENLTVSGLNEVIVCIGDIFETGEVIFQVSQPRQPCWKIARRCKARELPLWMEESGRCGFYFRVLKEGYLESGNQLVLTERSAPEWTVERSFIVLRDTPSHLESAQQLINLPSLSDRWRQSLIHHIEQGKPDDPYSRLIGPNE